MLKRVMSIFHLKFKSRSLFIIYLGKER